MLAQKQVLKALHESDSSKPAIFAMSNPTMNGLFFLPCHAFGFPYQTRYFVLTFCLLSHWTAECTAADAFKHAGENIVFASGSPFENVDLGIFHTN